jgi:hypothetical protein
MSAFTQVSGELILDLARYRVVRPLPYTGETVVKAGHYAGLKSGADADMPLALQNASARLQISDSVLVDRNSKLYFQSRMTHVPMVVILSLWSTFVVVRNANRCNCVPIRISARASAIRRRTAAMNADPFVWHVF